MVAASVSSTVLNIVLPDNLASHAPIRDLWGPLSVTKVLDTLEFVWLESNGVSAGLEEVEEESAVYFEEVGFSGVAAQLDFMLLLPGCTIIDRAHDVDLGLLGGKVHGCSPPS